jgi:isopentenyl-diphosphate delta-isomerase
MEYITIVDETGKIIGTEEKNKCHHGAGILHNAFLVMLFNEKAQLMLAKRSQQKMLWPDYWDGTVASHYHEDVSQMERIQQRIFYETGANCPQVEYLFKFRYHLAYEDIGSENEICDVFVAHDLQSDQLSLNKVEISEYKFLEISDVVEKIGANSQKIAPWFLIAFEKYLEAQESYHPGVTR